MTVMSGDLLQATGEGSISAVACIPDSESSPGIGEPHSASSSVNFCDSPLVAAIIAGNVKDVQDLLNAQAPVQDTSDEGMDTPPSELADTALHYLVDHWVVERPSAMRQIGVLLMERRVGVNALDSCGLTALHRAVIRDRLDACRFLLENGADPTVVADDLEQTTPIEDALAFGRMAMLEAMKDVAATAQVPMNRLFVPLHKVAESGTWRENLVQLLRMGVDINARDVRGRRPIDCLPTSGQGCLAAIYAFVGAGAQPSAPMLKSHGRNTLVGRALRTERIVAAATCASAALVAMALYDLPESGGSEEVALVMAALDRADEASAHVLRTWIASREAKAAMKEINAMERVLKGADHGEVA